MAGALSDFDDNEDADVSDINMVPLIDIMLVLLIIFMITLPVLTHAVKVDLPRAAAAPDHAEPQRITLSVNAEGAVYWNDERIDEDTLQKRLASAARQNPQPELHIRGDRKAEYEHVLQVMSAAQRAGVLKLGFITNPDSTHSGPQPSSLSTENSP